MPRYETRASQFGVVGSQREATSDCVLIAEPGPLFGPEARKGNLYIVTEIDPGVAGGYDACQLVARTIRKQFYDDSSYSVTSALRKAIGAANKALYQQNFSTAQQNRAAVGISCIVVREHDLYLAQVAPTQVYLLAEGKLRALPPPPGWSGGPGDSPMLLHPRAIGSSLTVEPDFYRAVMRPGDALVACSSQLARELSRETILQLLNAPDAAYITEHLVDLCKPGVIDQAHGLALTIRPALSAAAQSAPFSRTGVAERGRVLLRTANAHVARVSAAAALLVQGRVGQARREKADRRREQDTHEDARMTVLPEERHEAPHPLPRPHPLDLGPTLDETLDQERFERRTRLGMAPPRPRSPGQPPSTFLGEGAYYPPDTERRVDLSDTPGMGRRNGPPLTPTLGERLAEPFAGISSWMSARTRRRQSMRPPPRAMPQVRRQPGLSYRRQGPPFPWLLLLLLVLLVALLVVYGRGLAVENARQQAVDDLLQAEQAVAAVRDAPDDTEAQRRLVVAEESLGKVRASGIVTATVENRQRFEAAEREFERALAAIQKLTYFSDLVEIGQHPHAAAAASFSDLVIPPPAGAITNTAGFSSIYALDANAGVLYRMPRTGGQFEPFLRPTDSFASGVTVGKVRAMAWRIDNIVAVAQNEGGPFIYYFRSGDRWNFSNMGGSEEWAQKSDRPFRLVTYDGNLYIWGAAPEQILKYASGRPGDLYDPWLKNDGNRKLDTAMDLAIDGQVYLLQLDGRVLVFALNEFVREIAPPTVTPPLVTPSGGFVITGTPDGGSIFLVDTPNERIIQIDKNTGDLIQQIRARPEGPVRLNALARLSVDDSGPRPVLYMINGGQVLRASLPDRPRPFRDTSGPGTTTTPQPSSTTQPASDGQLTEPAQPVASPTPIP
jgi:hypothetical protein